MSELGKMTPRGRCQCTYEAGDSYCDVHPTCDYCGKDLALATAYTNGESSRYCQVCYVRLSEGRL